MFGLGAPTMVFVNNKCSMHWKHLELCLVACLWAVWVWAMGSFKKYESEIYCIKPFWATVRKLFGHRQKEKNNAL
jgi:hypothetical protein